MRRLVAALLSLAALGASLAAPASADQQKAYGACPHSDFHAARCNLDGFVSDVDAKENIVPISWD